MCVLKLRSLLMCQLITASWPCGIRSLLEGQAQLMGQMFWGQPPSSSQENPNLQCDHRRAGSASSYISYKKQHRALADPLPLISNHLAWLVPEAGYQTWWANGLFCYTVPVFLCNTALFVLSALCLSPVQLGRAGEGSQQHKDRIESCWSCKYLKVSKVPYLKYLTQNQGHYIFYDKRKWAFFFHSFPFRSVPECINREKTNKIFSCGAPADDLSRLKPNEKLVWSQPGK